MGTRVAFYLPSLRGGGAERSIVTLANAFAARGLDVDMVLATAEGPYLADLASDVRLVDLGARRVLTSLPGLSRYLRAEHPRALLAAMTHANVVAVMAHRLSRVSLRLVLSERNTLSRSMVSVTSLRSRGFLRMLRYAYTRADTIVAVSNGVADDLAHTVGLPRQRIEVVYNPIVSHAVFEKAAEPLDHPWFQAAAPPVILSVGRLNPQKDYATLLRAFAEVRQQMTCRLAILGEGASRDTLEALARDLGVWDDVTMPGFVPNPFNWMRKASVFVLSSAWEGLPGVLIQAMACGTPVVSTDCPSGPSEILAGGVWGRLVPVGDVEAVARAIEATLTSKTNPDVASRALDFGVEHAVDRYLAVLGIEG